MTAPVLEVEGVGAGYGATRVLFDVSLALAEGRTMALLGRNGAGKSTTLKAIAGLVPPRAGRVAVRGRELRGKRPHLIARAGVGYVPEDRQIFPEHTVEDNLLIGAKRGPGGEARWDLGRVYETFPTLQQLRHRPGGRLSGGQQQLLTIARTLMGNPLVLLLDEPTQGLAPIMVAQLAELLRALREQGTTMLLAEQNMVFSLEVANDVTVIDKGRVVHRDSAEGLRADDAVKRRYLAV